ncbi:MAG: site-2 protease family protein [Candidatus Acidiferrales bacterium]
MGNSTGNGHGRVPVEILDVSFPEVVDLPPPPRARAPHHSPWPAAILFFLTLMTTLSAGALIATSFAQNLEPFSGDEGLFSMVLLPFQHPRMLLLGIPFSLTLLGFFMAHEMGHYLACRYYRVDCSYPFFLPSPFPFGTFGAVIKIRAPITTRRALFDIGIAGPILGFIVAVPLTAYGIAASKVVPGIQDDSGLAFGFPALMKLFVGMSHPGADPGSVLFHPVALAAWIGLLATALNLLPVWQLDGGHILYSLAPDRHQRFSLIATLCLVFMGVRYWHGWAFWGIILLVLSLRFKHPPPFDRWESLDASRKLLACVAAIIFLLCFTLWPTNNLW